VGKKGTAVTNDSRSPAGAERGGWGAGQRKLRPALGHERKEGFKNGGGNPQKNLQEGARQGPESGGYHTQSRPEKKGGGKIETCGSGGKTRDRGDGHTSKKERKDSHPGIQEEWGEQQSARKGRGTSGS